MINQIKSLTLCSILQSGSRHLIIINIREYENLPERKGSDVDVRNLENAFR